MARVGPVITTNPDGTVTLDGIEYTKLLDKVTWHGERDILIEGIANALTDPERDQLQAQLDAHPITSVGFAEIVANRE